MLQFLQKFWKGSSPFISFQCSLPLPLLKHRRKHCNMLLVLISSSRTNPRAEMRVRHELIATRAIGEFALSLSIENVERDLLWDRLNNRERVGLLALADLEASALQSGDAVAVAIRTLAANYFGYSGTSIVSALTFSYPSSPIRLSSACFRETFVT